MKTVKHDRRSQRTHRLLAGALVELLFEHRYSDVTVQDILDRADIGRTTFYRHYFDKDDLLASEMERVLAVFSRQVHLASPPHTFPLPSLEIFQHLQEQQALYRVLVRGQAITVVLTTLKTCLQEQIEQHWRRTLAQPIDDLSVQIAAQAVAGTFITLLQWWMDNDMPLSQHKWMPVFAN